MLTELIVLIIDSFPLYSDTGLHRGYHNDTQDRHPYTHTEIHFVSDMYTMAVYYDTACDIYQYMSSVATSRWAVSQLLVLAPVLLSGSRKNYIFGPFSFSHKKMCCLAAVFYQIMYRDLFYQAISLTWVAEKYVM